MADDNNHDYAYDRANVYHQFANIVQHYNDTARPDHDNIDYDSPDDFDGIEYDHNGQPVISIDIAYIVYHIATIADAINEYGSFADIPDDFEFGDDDTPISFDWIDDCRHYPAEHRHWRCDNKHDNDNYPDLS